MNISAPSSNPDPGSLALLLATAPDNVAAFPGFAPPQSLPVGAGAFHSFESTLAGLLSLDGEPEAEPEEQTKQQESKMVITGVTISAPQAQALPLEFAMPRPASVQGESAPPAPAPAPFNLLAGIGKAPKAMASKPDLVSAQPEAVAPFPFMAPTPEPTAAPRAGFEPVLIMTQPAAATVPELPAQPELPNLAFTEKFTSMAAPQERSALPAESSPLPTPPVNNANSNEFAKPRGDALLPSAPANMAEPAGMPEQPRHGNGEQQHSSGGESPAQSKTVAEPAAREDRGVEKPGFDPLTPITVASKEAPRAEPAPAAAVAKSPDTPNLEPESRLQPAPSSHAPDAHAISVRVTDAGDTRVELKVTEHAGELRVSVHAADPELAGSLRENLGELVHKLEQSGFRADTWHPAQSSSPENNPQTTRTEGESLGGDHPGRQQQHSGDGGERRQQDPERARWLEELDTSFAPDSERKAPTWLPASAH